MIPSRNHQFFRSIRSIFVIFIKNDYHVLLYGLHSPSPYLSMKSVLIPLFITSFTLCSIFGLYFPEIFFIFIYLTLPYLTFLTFLTFKKKIHTMLNFCRNSHMKNETLHNSFIAQSPSLESFGCYT